MIVEDKKVSYSQYAMHYTCPWQWKLAYIDKLKPEDSSIELIFGTAIHNTIQEWLAFHYDKKSFSLEPKFRVELIELFKTSFRTAGNGLKEPVCDRITFEEYYRDGVFILSYLQLHKNTLFPTKDIEFLGIELPLSVKLKDHLTFGGYVDILTKNTVTGDVFIDDLKTSKKGWRYNKQKPEKINQLLLYKKFYAEQFDIPLDKIHIRFLILKRKLEGDGGNSRIYPFIPPHDEKDVTKATESFNEFLSDVFDKDGNYIVEQEKRPSESNCKFCHFNQNKTLCEKSYYLEDTDFSWD